jgi:hypothetical protein
MHLFKLYSLGCVNLLFLSHKIIISMSFSLEASSGYSKAPHRCISSVLWKRTRNMSLVKGLIFTERWLFLLFLLCELLER